jgi:tyrosyl-tRNA synthetase
MARTIADLYHGEGLGAAAEQRFDLVHRDRALPDEVADVAIPDDVGKDGVVYLPALLVGLGRASSKSAARRLVEQGGVKLNGEVLTDPDLEAETSFYLGNVLQVGRRWFGRLSL